MKNRKSAIFARVMVLILGFAFIGCKADSNSGENLPNGNADYGIDLSETSTYTFPAATAGYGAQPQKSVTITNTGNQHTGDLTVTLSSGTAFTLDKTTIASIAVNGSGTFTVVPKTGLAEGFYSATVTVSGGIVSAKSFDVRFTVNNADGSQPDEAPDNDDTSGGTGDSSNEGDTTGGNDGNSEETGGGSEKKDVWMWNKYRGYTIANGVATPVLDEMVPEYTRHC
jgi:hypothetical protein